MSVRVLCPFIDGLFGVGLYDSLYIFGMEPLLVGAVVCKYLVPFGWWPFCFVGSFFFCAEDF